MNTDKLELAVDLAAKTGFALVATADNKAIPHIAAAGKVELTEKNCLAVTEWFCPRTVGNLRKSRKISIVIWDKSSDTGFQLIGRLKKTEDMHVLDGYVPAIEGPSPLPQMEKRLTVRIERVSDFKLGPHSDVEEKIDR